MNKLSKVEIQNTPIKSLLLSWWEGETLNTVEVPLSWALQILIEVPKVSDAVINDKRWQNSLLACIKHDPAEWIEYIKSDKEWSSQITTNCSYEIIPEIFKT